MWQTLPKLHWRRGKSPNFGRSSSGGRKGGFGCFHSVKLAEHPAPGTPCMIFHHCNPRPWPWLCVPIKFKIYHPLTINWLFLDQYLPLGSINLDIHFKSSQYLLIDFKNNEKYMGPNPWAPDGANLPLQPGFARCWSKLPECYNFHFAF